MDIRDEEGEIKCLECVLNNYKEKDYPVSIGQGSPMHFGESCVYYIASKPSMHTNEYKNKEAIIRGIENLKGTIQWKKRLENEENELVAKLKKERE